MLELFTDLGKSGGGRVGEKNEAFFLCHVKLKMPLDIQA